jgi:hypothetical protein
MIPELIGGTIFIVWAVLSLSLWRKRKDADYLWFLWFGVIGVCGDIVSLLLKYVIHAPVGVISLYGLLLLGFGVVAILILAWIGFKMLIGRRNM